jgi:hypothetical protein
LFLCPKNTKTIRARLNKQKSPRTNRSKGNQVHIPEPGRGKTKAAKHKNENWVATQSNSETSAESPGKSYLFFLTAKKWCLLRARGRLCVCVCGWGMGGEGGRKRAFTPFATPPPCLSSKTPTHTHTQNNQKPGVLQPPPLQTNNPAFGTSPCRAGNQPLSIWPLLRRRRMSRRMRLSSWIGALPCRQANISFDHRKKALGM